MEYPTSHHPRSGRNGTRGGASLTAVALLLLLFASACASSRLPPAGAGEPAAPPAGVEPAYRVLLVGGMHHALSGAASPVLRLILARLDTLGPDAALVFLGDNADDVPADSAAPLSGTRLGALLEAVRDFEGRILFIPGDRDWNRGRRDGLEARLCEEAFVERVLGREDAFLPDGGLPGPATVELTEHLTLVALDTQWWLHPNRKPYGEAGGYEVEEDQDFLLALDDVVRRARNKSLLVVGHHDLRSVGAYAGRFPLKAHLFPLTELDRRAYLPLPLVGSLPLLYARHFGTSRQHLAHPRYQELRRALASILEQHSGLIYASGHEHGLEYFPSGNPLRSHRHYLVSGAGSDVEYLSAPSAAGFTAGEPGFLELSYFDDGSVWMEAWTPEGGGERGRLLFRRRLEGPNPERVGAGRPAEAAGPLPDYRDSTVLRPANARYARGRLHQLVYGKHYRRQWATPVRLPVLDLEREAGGLTLLRRGGGVQTASLHLGTADGKQFLLRSIDKDPARALPAGLRSGLAAQLVQDFNSSLHPFGGLVVPRLADAAGVYHATPKAVFVPDDPRLGVYRAEFAGRVMLLEERPDGDMTGRASFGGARRVIGAAKLEREIASDSDHRVDQRAFARARLLDLLIADWDRHPDQWRWGAFEPADSAGLIFRPIPRDHDWAFSRFDGLVPSVVRYVMPKFQGFGRRYGSLRGLTRKGMTQDHRFTSELDRADWIRIADSLRSALTDEVIAAAVGDQPAPIVATNGRQMTATLAARRDGLVRVAERMYGLHARTVDVLGSDKHERFEVTRLRDGATEVVMYKTTKEGEVRRESYRRTFRPSETREIRLHGLDGRDRFILAGRADRGILIRAIGGAGEDEYVDRSSVRAGGAAAVFYDSWREDRWEAGPNTRRARDRDAGVNSYDRGGFQAAQTLPIVRLESSRDAGFVLGGGVRFIRPGFRRQPFGQAHRVEGAFATGTRAAEASYAGRFTAAVGGWDLELGAVARSPNTLRNVYGLGNETVGGEAGRYRARLGEVRVASLLLRRFGEGAEFHAGPSLAYASFRQEEARGGAAPPSGLPADAFGRRLTAGAGAGMVLEGRDSRINPAQGIFWHADAELKQQLSGGGDRYAALRSNLALYVSPVRSPQVTIAARVGGGHLIGAFPIDEANTLGGERSLRGYRSTRFAGRTSFFQNVELRVQLLRFSTYVAGGRLGALGFVDNGRVWQEGEASRSWHRGYGGGAWLELFDRFVLTGTLGRSAEGTSFTLGTGFLF